jgi:hypothetical protein
MRGWVKHFNDGTSESGTDRAIKAHRVSWRNGRLDGMCGAELMHDLFHIEIVGKGDYWQSDLFVAKVFAPGSRLIGRQLQKQIRPEDKGLLVSRAGNKLTIQVLATPADKLDLEFNQSHVGQWVTIYIDLLRKTTDWSVQKDRI